jgi:hypothetical protein
MSVLPGGPEVIGRRPKVFHIAQIDLDQTWVSTPALSSQIFLGFNQ